MLEVGELRVCVGCGCMETSYIWVEFEGVRIEGRGGFFWGVLEGGKLRVCRGSRCVYTWKRVTFGWLGVEGVGFVGVGGGVSEWRVLIEVRIEVRDLTGWREGVGGRCMYNLR